MHYARFLYLIMHKICDKNGALDVEAWVVTALNIPCKLFLKINVCQTG